MTPKKALKKATETPKDSEKATSLLRGFLDKINLKPIKNSPMSYVPSGSFLIDNLIGGYPRRKITDLSGPESSGKTSVALAAAAAVQRGGGSVLYIDFTRALHHGYAQSEEIQASTGVEKE